jgi:hypothetical protein
LPVNRLASALDAVPRRPVSVILGKARAGGIGVGLRRAASVPPALHRDGAAGSWDSPAGNGRQMRLASSGCGQQIGRDVGAHQQAQRIESCAKALVWLAMSAWPDAG